MQGSLHLVLYEKSCASPSQCGLSGEKHAACLNFTYQNYRCDTDLCNEAMAHAAPIWRGGALCILVIFSLILS
ncbi:unnamed protein product [Oncorhynchus mykiss]|uniref:UPAR/Ly6 domain-containing protein n=1 Tax=Oncorhynchus mykiss TaxID=8022 RepID=A0A060WWH6_ONCMY|nr:unnamed protein product [Oncorhynchus mykiss]